MKAKKRLSDLTAARAKNVAARAREQASLRALAQRRGDVAHAATPVVKQFNHTAAACRIYLDNAASRAAKRQGLIDAVLGVTASFAEASGLYAHVRRRRCHSL